MVVPLSGLSSYYAAVATEIQALSATTDVAVVVTMAAIAVSGLSFFSSSAVADAAAMVAVSNLPVKNGDGISVASFIVLFALFASFVLRMYYLFHSLNTYSIRIYHQFFSFLNTLHLFQKNYFHQ